MLTKTKPIEHFKELVTEAVAHQKVETNEMAVFYLSTLLSDFVLSERLATEPLAITYLKAQNETRAVKVRLMRHLGDLSLFTSGFFSDSLARKAVDVDYYISMGTSCYNSVASIHRQGRKAHISSLYTELAVKFGVFADVLTEVSERSRLTSSKDILRIYERWLRTKSKQAERLLRSLGIEPHDVGTPVH
ncbi:MAG: hypothetical protein ACE5GY_07960 [Thermodesulfobacteriota bacterium]